MSLGGSTVPFGAETSGLTELKVMGTGSKSFASGSLREVVGGTTPLSITDSWTWECGKPGWQGVLGVKSLGVALGARDWVLAPPLTV